MNELEQLRFVTHMARCEMLEYLTVESCIFATRTVCDLIRDHVGLPCRALTVEPVAMNAPARAMVKIGKEISDDDDLALIHKIDYQHLEPGEHGDEEGFFPGHVCLIADERYLIDPSADQFSWPDHDLTVEPFAIDMTEEMDDFQAFLNEERELCLELDEGGVLIFRAHPDNVAFNDAPDWQDYESSDAEYQAQMVNLRPTIEEKVVGLLDLYRDQPMPRLPRLPDAPRTREITPREQARRIARAVMVAEDTERGRVGAVAPAPKRRRVDLADLFQ